MSQDLQTALTRVANFDLTTRGSDEDGIPVIVSTDQIVEVKDGAEILVHHPAAVDLSRAPLPLIATHADGQINVGIVENIRLSGGQMRGTARFGKRPEAAGYREDVLSGIIRSVSVGYARLKGGFRNDGVLVITRWMPTHVAMIAEPADAAAGFFREFSGISFTPDEIIPNNPEAPVIEPPDVATRSVSQPANPAIIEGATSMSAEINAPAGATADITATERGTPEQRMSAVELETARKKAIRNMCSGANLEARFGDNWINSGASLESVADEIVAVVAERARDTAPAGIGMTKKEVQRYSLLRAVRAAHTGDWSKAGLELEASKTIGNERGAIPREAGAFFVPMEVQMRGRDGRRDMTVAGVQGSNYLVGTDNLAGSFIDLLRNESAVLGLGATRLTGLVGNITIPKMTAGGTAYWLADESTQITESQPTIGQLALSPKDVAALTQISHKLMQQSTPDAEALVMRDLAITLGLAADVACLRGSGASGQPHGIIGTSGLGSFDTDATNTFADVLEAQVDVMAANALRPGCAYLADPVSAALLMGRSRFANTDTPVWNGNLMEGTMAGFPCRASNQMGANTMLFGWWPSIIVAEWGQLELVVNRFSDETRGLVSVRAWYQMDTGMRYPAAFSYDASVA